MQRGQMSIVDRRTRSSPKTAVAGKDHRLGTSPHAELVEQVGDVVADRLLADRQALADLGVAQSLTAIRLRTSRSLAESEAKAGSSPAAGAATPRKSPRAFLRRWRRPRRYVREGRGWGRGLLREGA